MCVTENYSVEEKFDRRWDEGKGLKKGKYDWIISDHWNL